MPTLMIGDVIPTGRRFATIWSVWDTKSRIYSLTRSIDLRGYMKYAIKSAIKSGLSAFGIEIYRNRGRGIGTIAGFLGDIRARGFKPRGIIDVGANRGDWTRVALSIFPDASVIMIEPQDEMQPYLSKLCSSE